MRAPPYIGITGFMLHREAEDVLRSLPADFSRQLMVGVLVSDKTLRNIPNRLAHRYPKLSALGTIFSRHPRALNLIHFNTKSLPALADDMVLAQKSAGEHCHGFQLNISWPDPAMLRRYREDPAFDRKIIVLQCGKQAMSEVHGSGRQLAHRLEEYEGLIDHVLIDASGGDGREFEYAAAYEYFTYLDKVPWLAYGIAGGHETSNVRRLIPLLEKFPQFSIDAEGRLRDSDDDLDLHEAVRYVHESAELIKQYAGKKIYKK